MRSGACLAIAAAPLLLGFVSQAAVLPAGTNLEVRLLDATGSRISHAGDRVEAIIVAPASQRYGLTLPAGTIVSGKVESVSRVGFGIHHPTASLQFRFNQLRLRDGRVLPLSSRVREVETAKEHVTERGGINGISPAANLSSGASFVIAALFVQPEIAAPVLAVKFLIARSPDPEIYFPAGTELVLQLTSDAELPDLDAAPTQVAPMSDSEIAEVSALLGKLPQQQTNRGHDHPSDLVNILLLGSHEQVERAFHAAGWNGAQEHSVLALYRMYHCIVQRAGYVMAPMTRLKLNGMIPDLSYQKSLDTFAKRHHIRLWNQERSDAWFGAATEDVSYAVKRMHVTHAADPAIDNERAKVANDLWFTGCVDSAALIPRNSLKPVDEDGVSILTDGSIAVLRLNDCQNPAVGPPLHAGSTAPKRCRFSQVMLALSTDLARSNPVALTLNVVKSFSTASALKNQQLGFRKTPDASRGEVELSPLLDRYKWHRASFIESETALAHTAHEAVPCKPDGKAGSQSTDLR